MRRIIIVGVTGSGKTTFGKKLSQALDIHFTDMDDLHWLPNWVMRTKEDFCEQVSQVVSNDEWILAGNYSKQRDVSWSRADTLIFVRTGFLRCLWQLFKRTIRRSFSKEKCCNGNVESFSKSFCSKDSLFIWFFKTYFEKTNRYTDIMLSDKYNHLNKIMLSSIKEQNQFLNKIVSERLI